MQLRPLVTSVSIAASLMLLASGCTIRTILRTGAIGIGCLLAVVAMTACGGDSRPNVLIVTWDTTRADQLGAYGNERIQTPNADELASKGVRFSRAYSSIALTFPSHTTLLTGLYPPAHGIRDNGMFVLSEEVLTLPEILHENGYATAAAVGGFPLVARFRLDQGFDLYDDRLTRRDLDYLGRKRAGQESMYFEERSAGMVNQAILPWLEEHRDGPFFAWVHYYDPHRPWVPPPPYDSLYADDPYKGEIAYADEMLGNLLGSLREWGTLENTLVILTADHGEGLGEHNETTHSMLIYDSTLRVPLVVVPPGGGEGRVVDDLVAGVDIVPTVLDMVGIEKPDNLQGHSLLGYLTGGEGVPSRRRFYAETLSPRLAHGWGELRALYLDDWKYIHGPRPELFDLAADPGELNNLVTARGEIGERMRSSLETFIRETSIDAAAVAQPVDEETRNQLMALGYFSASGESEPVEEILRDDGEAPQDRVVDLNLSSEVRAHLAAGRGAAAQQVAIELLRNDPGNAFYSELLIRAHLISGDVSEGARLLEEQLEVDGARPVPGGLLVSTGSALLRAGQRERAVQMVRRGIESDRSADLLYQVATIENEVGNTVRVRLLLEEILEKEPAFARARVDLAIREVIEGDPEQAESDFLRALVDDPFYPKGHHNYGTFLYQARRPAEAASYFERAVELEPRYLQARLALVAARLSSGDQHEALEALQALESIAPQSPEALSAREIYETDAS